MAEKEVTFVSNGERDKETKTEQKLRNILTMLSMLLRKDNRTKAEYAEELGLKVDTVKNYFGDINKSFDEVKRTGFYVNYDRKDRVYKLVSHFDLPEFLPEEIEGLYIAIRHLSRQEGTPFEHLGEVERKLGRYYTKDIRERLKKKVGYSGPFIRSRLTEMVNVIDEAINDKKKIIMSYHKTSSKEPEIREVFPYSIHSHGYEWYLRAFCFRDEKVKTYAVNQIGPVRCEKLSKGERGLLPGSPEIIPEHRWDWDSPYISGEKVKVRIRFFGHMAEKMRKKTEFIREHPSQITEDMGEDFVVSFEVKNPCNMVRWILEFGGGAEVLEPEVLRERMREEIGRIGKLYE